MFFSILATFAEFEADLLKMRTREGMAVARAKGKLKGSSPNCRPASRPGYAGCTPPTSAPSPGLAEVFFVSRATVYRVLQRAEKAKST